MLMLGIVFIVGFVNIYLMVPTSIMVVIFYKLRDFNLPTSRGIKRLEGVSKYILYIIKYRHIRHFKTQYYYLYHYK